MFFRNLWVGIASSERFHNQLVCLMPILSYRYVKVIHLENYLKHIQLHRIVIGNQHLILPFTNLLFIIRAILLSLINLINLSKLISRLTLGFFKQTHILKVNSHILAYFFRIVSWLKTVVSQMLYVIFEATVLLLLVALAAYVSYRVFEWECRGSPNVFFLWLNRQVMQSL